MESYHKNDSKLLIHFHNIAYVIFTNFSIKIEQNLFVFFFLSNDK